MSSCKIIETCKNGKMHRECSNCKTDVTNITMWISYKYCPWCGNNVEGKEYQRNESRA